ncbi:WhiB family transcriptional regulator [Microbacterium sp. NPDC090225]|uniref:WhiB family transcriptional regulator n=1 Tax=Microbacterium sp. NPDC090225 TaxID=3364207 RepID=UPI00383008DE
MTQEWLSYAEAARRTKSSTATINRWRREGMPMEWRTDDGGQRSRVVELQVLLEWWRSKMASNPAHFYRLRKRAIEAGMTPPQRPAPKPRILTGQYDRLAPEEAPVERPKIEMPRVRASDEYDALTASLRHVEPACRDDDDFTADRPTPEVIERMRAVCASCDVLERCSVFAAAERPTGGFWAGETDAERRTTPAVA